MAILIDTYSTDRMQELYMTKADKVELIDRIRDESKDINEKINHVSIDFTDRMNNLENKMLSKMETNFRLLVGVTITGIATTATIVKLIS